MTSYGYTQEAIKKQSIQLIEKNKRAKFEERETGEDLQLNVLIIDRILHPKGVLFTFDKKGKQVRILFLRHGIDRMAKWKLTPEMVGETLLEPEEVLIGHYNRFIAHKCYGQHILRAVYEYDDLNPSLITVYFPHKDRYYEGGERFENKILK